MFSHFLKAHRLIAIGKIMKLECDERFPLLYKYIKSKYVPDLLGKGRIRVGTLHEYRNIEHSQIGDKGEGTKMFSTRYPKDLVGNTANELNRKFPHLRVAASDEIVIPVNRDPRVPVALKVESPNCFVFCLTSEFSELTMKEFGCDACLEVDNPWAFFKEISKGMERHSYFGVLERVRYENRWGEIYSHHSVRPQVLKPEFYKHQSEVRMLWDPRFQLRLRNLNAIFVQRPSIAKYCRRIA